MIQKVIFLFIKKDEKLVLEVDKKVTNLGEGNLNALIEFI